MKRIRAEYPYSDYYLYIVKHTKYNRNYANLIPVDSNSNLKRHTISYARYLMSVKEGRILRNDEHVDHIDNDKTNDDINNLQIMSLAENNRKEAIRHGKHMVLLKCPFCKKEFSRERRNTHIIKGGITSSCSRSCANNFKKLLLSEPNSEKVLKAIKENVIKEYTEH